MKRTLQTPGEFETNKKKKSPLENTSMNQIKEKPNKVNVKDGKNEESKVDLSAKSKSEQIDEFYKEKTNKLLEQLRNCDNNVNTKKAVLTKLKKLFKGRGHQYVTNYANKLFEKLRKAKCPKETKIYILNQLMELFEGIVVQVSRSHDMSRIIQWMLKLGNNDIKKIIFGEIRDNILELAKHKYSHHVIASILKYCSTAERKKIIESFSTDTVPLLNCKFSVGVLEEAYTKYANSQEKLTLRRSLYGPIFNCSSSNLKTFCEQYPDLAPAVLMSTKTNLLKLIRKDWCQKSLIVTFVLEDFLNVCPVAHQKEILDSIRPYIDRLICTNKGCYSALKALWNSTVKEKKIIIKALQENVIQIVKTEPGSYFLISLMDSVDDTVLMKKAIICKLMAQLEELILNNNARRVIIYIFMHRNAVAFISEKKLEKLKEADSSNSLKKDSHQRLIELRDSCIIPILKSIEDHPKLWISNGPLALMTSTVFQHCTNSSLNLSNEFESACNAISSYVTSADNLSVNKDGVEIDVIEDSRVHTIIKKLIKDDCVRFEKKFLTFSECLLNNTTTDTISRWVSSNRGCFTLLFLLESSFEVVTSTITNFFSNQKLLKKLNKQNATVGGKLLKNKIDTLLHC